MRMSRSLTLVCALFLLLDCCVQFQCDSLYSPYYILFCYLWLLSFRSLFFSNERQEGNGSTGEVKWGETGRNRERGDYNQNILYEKRIYVQ